MIRILFFLIVVFALGLGFAWLADRPGDMVVTLSGYQYQVSLMVAAVAVTAVVAAVMILWWLVKAIWNSPYTISRYFRVRRRDRGYQALVDRHDRGGSRRWHSRPQDEQTGGQADQRADRAADPAARRAGVAA